MIFNVFLVYVFLCFTTSGISQNIIKLSKSVSSLWETILRTHPMIHSANQNRYILHHKRVDNSYIFFSTSSIEHKVAQRVLHFAIIRMVFDMYQRITH